MSYYYFNRKNLLQKAKDKYHSFGGKEKATKYYIWNKEVLKENAKNKYRNLSEEEKMNMEKIEIETWKNEKTCENINFWYNIEMNKKTLKFGGNE